MELCDVVDAYGTRTGRIVERGTLLPPGEYYPVVQVWIQGDAGEYLIQQRAPHVTSPGVWATTAGYVISGEDSLAGAIREIEEELGLRLSPGYFTQFDRLWTDNRMEDIWIATVPAGVIGTPKPGPEVSACRWETKQAMRAMIARGEFFGYRYFERLPE